LITLEQSAFCAHSTPVKNETKKRLRPAKNLSLLPELVRKIEMLASAEGRSISSYVEQLMREDVETYEKEKGLIKLPAEPLRVVTTKTPRPVRLAKKKKGDSDAACA
jgi:hypothetical protein